jgi:CheY-like chemotaxis protein
VGLLSQCCKLIAARFKRNGVKISESQNKILIVDDTPEHLALVVRLLRHAGFEILTAGDAIQGLTIARHERPDLVI